MPSKLSGTQLGGNLIGPRVDSVPIAEITLDDTSQARDRTFTQRQQRRLVATRERTQLTAIDVSEQRPNTVSVLLRMLGHAVHTDGESPDLLVTQLILKTLHKFVRLGHPLKDVDGRADDHRIVRIDRGHISGCKTINGTIRRLQTLRNGVGDFVRRPVL